MNKQPLFYREFLSRLNVGCPSRAWPIALKPTQFVMRIHLLLLAAFAAASSIPVHARPFENGHFQGRIAYSCDGNHNDPDDWIASPVSLAIFAETGLRDRVVHFDYNSILPLTHSDWEKTHERRRERC